ARGRMPAVVAAALLVMCAPGGGAAAPAADLVLTGGRVWTGDAARPWAEALAVHRGRLTYVGDAAGTADLRGPGTRVIDLAGRLVVPGFNDAHIHLMSGALSLERVDLIEDGTVEAVQERIRAFARANPSAPWVLGRGWLYGAFPGGLPTKEQLDAAVPDRPAYMECYDGHSGWANSKALAAAGITRDTPDTVGGAIVRDPSTGEPTGALKESAVALVEKVIPAPSVERRYALLLQALQRLNAQGITSIQDAGYGLEELGRELPLLERAVAEGKMTVRLRAAVRLSPTDFGPAIAEARRLAARHRGPLLRFGTVKAFVDGVIEAHTAAMLEPYVTAPFGTGAPNWEPAALARAVTEADAASLQVYLHAIGDGGVRMAMDAHEAALRANRRPDRRGRIEHIETIHPAEYPRFAALGVIASMQPLHANPDTNNDSVWKKNIGPERASRGFGWRAIEKAGGRLVFGSDWPVVTSDVMRGLYVALTRKTREGLPAGGWLPGQAVSLESALRHYTSDAAFASFEEGEKGTLAVGRRADLVVLSRDLFAEPPEAILTTRPLLTLLEGAVVYQDPGYTP
ncbi:MAG TPA: amidohydrolase, partial [Vicinamibacteria bacterium]|nr:amidohydrolase [Vicinamibacteria bacterium]